MADDAAAQPLPKRHRLQATTVGPCAVLVLLVHRACSIACLRQPFARQSRPGLMLLNLQEGAGKLASLPAAISLTTRQLSQVWKPRSCHDTLTADCQAACVELLERLLNCLPWIQGDIRIMPNVMAMSSISSPLLSICMHVLDVWPLQVEHKCQRLTHIHYLSFMSFVWKVWADSECVQAGLKPAKAAGKPGFYAQTPDGTSFTAGSFSDLHLSRPLLRACTTLGYTGPTPIQVLGTQPIHHRHRPLRYR